jgi:uncharacterized protein (TIGR03663 family)
MASITSGLPTTERTDPLKAVLGRQIFLRWETLVFVAILVAAIFTRLYALGDRAMSHDESLHVYYSYNLYMRGDFDHTPLMHGPILFHTTAFFYALFGDNDFTGRLYPALLGIGLVMMPLLFRRWLGRWGTILASIMLLISPLLLYYNRYIRHDTPSIMAAILMVWAAMMYTSGPESERRKPRYLYLLSAAMLWNLGSKETAFIYIALFGTFLTLYWLFRLAQARFGIAARQWFNSLMLAILFGGVFAIAMYTIVGITPLDEVSVVPFSELTSNLVSRSFILWTIGAVIVVAAMIVGPLLWAFRGRFNRIPWITLLLIALTAIFVTAVFLFIENRSHIKADQIGVAAPLDPEAAENGENGAASLSRVFLLAPWLLMIASLALFYVSRRKNAEGRDWWDWLDQFPELDVLWVMGSLILPWITAVFFVFARGTENEFIAIGNSFQFLSEIIPITDPKMVGQFVVAALCWLPLMITSIAAGLTWNWRRFLVCWLIFHGLFAFFFTTMFTNIQGLATGMIYSLQYWLEQQAERRGSQPQYYYTLIVLPLYEFLPIIGSVAAALGGGFIFWKRRARVAELEAEDAANNKQKHLLESGIGMAAENGEITPEIETANITEDGEPELEYSAPPLTVNTDFDTRSERIHRELSALNTLTQVPFLLFVGFWAVLNIIMYTLAGEKMPWLGTHMTTPMIFLAAWYFGRIFDRIDFATVRKIGWLNLLVYPLLIAAVFQLVTLQFTGRGPFQGVSQPKLENTYSWLAAAVVAITVAWGLQYLRRITGAQHSRQMFAVAAFSVLSLLTFRSAWMASFINYDLPNEFLVYAHATSGTKTVMNALEELSKRTTDGMGIPFAYDHKLSWPGAWYFRHFTKATYMGDTPTLHAMENALVVIVGDENRNVVEPLLEDRYQRFDFKRMWWPMQDYFHLTAARVIDFFELQDDPNDPADRPSAQMRHGVWDIFWMRDYTKFGEATRRTYTFNEWPVSENMYMYVRKDFAVQVWPYGIGDGSVTNPIADTEVSACVANWQEITASVVFDMSALGGALELPIGLDVNGNRVLVAEDRASRISEFGITGGYIRSIGQRGPADMAGPFFERPHSVKVASDGSIVVVDTWNYRIRVFNPDWEQIAVWGQPLTVGIAAPEEPRDGFWGPRDVAIGPDDLVYIADTGNKRVRVYTLDGTWVRDLGSGGSGEGQLNEPTGIAIHSDGRVFIADTWNRRISVFAPDGTWLAHYQVRAWYEEYGNRPYMALDEARNLLYVTDPDGGRVLVYSINGDCLGAFGRLNRENPGASEFSTIGGIDVDAEGNIYVADQNKGRLLKFPPFPVTALEMSSEADTAGESVPLEVVPEATEEEAPSEQSPQG